MLCGALRCDNDAIGINLFWYLCGRNLVGGGDNNLLFVCGRLLWGHHGSDQLHLYRGVRCRVLF